MDRHTHRPSNSMATPYLPRDKADLATVAALDGMDDAEIAPLVPHLLTWLQDMNWPVAKALAPRLASMGSAILAEVHAILKGKDEVWTYWVLQALVSQWPAEDILRLKPELERLAATPSEEEVDVVAWEILGLGRS